MFEALHHSMQICNPLSIGQLDEALEALELEAGSTFIDVACGYGEFLLRAATTVALNGVGIDLSPWMVTAAHRGATAARALQLHPGSKLRWIIGEARDFRLKCTPDVAVCIGAEWVWHDFSGTARALADQLEPGGQAVIGAARLHTQADQNVVRQERGFVESVDDQVEVLARHGLVPQHRIDPRDGAWDHYLTQTAIAAAEWAARFPGPNSDHWIREQAEWQQARERDRGVMGWSLWITRKAATSE